MDYTSEDKNLESSVNDLMSRALKLESNSPASYGDLLIVLKAVLDLRRCLDNLNEK